MDKHNKDQKKNRSDVNKKSDHKGKGKNPNVQKRKTGNK